MTAWPTVVFAAAVAGTTGWMLTRKYAVEWHWCKCLVRLRAEDAWTWCARAWAGTGTGKGTGTGTGTRGGVTPCRDCTASTPTGLDDSDEEMPGPEMPLTTATRTGTGPATGTETGPSTGTETGWAMGAETRQTEAAMTTTTEKTVPQDPAHAD